MRGRNNNAWRLFALPLALFAMATRCAGAAVDDWQFKLSTATDKVLRGFDLSDRNPYAEAAASWYAGSGPFADVSVSSFALFGPNRPKGVQLVADAGYAWRIEPDWTAQVTVSHYQSWDTPAMQHMRYQELALTAGWRDMVLASVAMSPRAILGPLPPGRTLAYDLVGRLPLAHGLTATAGIGYYDLRASTGPGYGYGNIGLSYQYRSVQLDVMYVATTGAIKALVNGALDNRWVGQVTWHF